MFSFIVRITLDTRLHPVNKLTPESLVTKLVVHTLIFRPQKFWLSSQNKTSWMLLVALYRLSRNFIAWVETAGCHEWSRNAVWISHSPLFNTHHWCYHRDRPSCAIFLSNPDCQFLLDHFLSIWQYAKIISYKYEGHIKRHLNPMLSFGCTIPNWKLS